MSLGSTISNILAATPECSQEPTHVGRKGDIEVALVYHAVDPDHGREACMRLKHTIRGTEVLVPMSSAWRWNEPQQMTELAGAAAEKLYPFLTRDDVYRVLDCVLDFVEDLIRHPPERNRDRTLDDFLDSLDRQGLRFFVETNAGTKVLT